MAGCLFGSLSVGREWAGAFHEKVEIDLSPAALPRYTLFSLSRGLLAYVLSLAFTLVYGNWAAKDARAERLLMPLLDILQSIPVLGFLPGLVLLLVGLFPSRNVGLELAAVLMIFTSQAWNMTFSYYQSVRNVPKDLREVTRVYRFSRWETFRWLELKFATTGLVWNSMMSMAGGWFFLMIAESFRLGDRDFRLPGLGSYMTVAVEKGDVAAMTWAVVAMVAMIVAIDQLLWRPLVAWSERFRIEESGSQEKKTSWFLDWLTASRLVAWVRTRRLAPAAAAAAAPRPRRAEPARGNAAFSAALLALCAALLLYGIFRVAILLAGIPLREWWDLATAASLTLGRVLATTLLGTLWALPVGLWIGLSPRLSRILQPVVQIAASFPAPMLFPAAIVGMRALGISLDWGAIFLMVLGTQWYILFNVVAGATSVPSDLREAAAAYRFGTWRRFCWLYAPAILPYLVTGWVTAAGGAWNASIVAEYVTVDKTTTLTAHGLGAWISQAAEKANYPVLAAAVTVMSIFVVLFNAVVWRRLYALAERRFSASR